MISNLKKILWPGLSLLIGFGLYGSAKLPDETFTQVQVLGAFVVFCVFAITSLKIGSFLQNKIIRAEGSSEQIALTFIFSTLVIYGGSLFLGHVWMPLSLPGFLLKGLLLGGIFGANILLPQIPKIKNLHAMNSLESRAIGFLIVLLIALFLLQGFKLPAHGDAFIYSLMAPRYWVDTGRIWIPESHPYFGQAGSWDTLYLWGHVLLGQSQGRGLIAAQHFAQWMHVFFGFLGSALVLNALLGKVFTALTVQWRWLAVFGALTVPALMTFASLAKNDWGSIFWTLAGTLLIIQPRTHFLAGLFLGFAFTAKFSTAYCIVGVLLWNVLTSKSLGWKVGLGFLVGSAPILLRNYYYTGSPLFPAYDFGFLGPTLKALHQVHHEQMPRLISIAGMFKEIFSQNFLFATCVIPFVFYKQFKTQKTWFLFFAAISFSVLFFSVHLGQTGMVRWLGPALTLGIALTLTGLGLCAQKKSKAAFWIVFLICLAQANIPLFNLAQLGSPKFATGREAILTHTNGESKSWVRQNLPTHTKLLLIGDNEPYYLSHYSWDVIEENPELDRKLFGIDDKSVFFEAIKNHDVIVEYKPHSHLYQKWSDEYLLQDPTQLLFSNEVSRVVKIKK